MLMKTRNHVRFVWEKDGIKSFMLILSILLLCLKLKSTNLISDQTTFHSIVFNSNYVNVPEKLCLIWTTHNF